MPIVEFRTLQTAAHGAQNFSTDVLKYSTALRAIAPHTGNSNEMGFVKKISPDGSEGRAYPGLLLRHNKNGLTSQTTVKIREQP